MVDPNSPLAQFYPADFETDLNGKRNAWESVVKIPFLDAPKMFETLGMIDHATALTAEERLRNLAGTEHCYRPIRAVAGGVASNSTPAPAVDTNN